MCTTLRGILGTQILIRVDILRGNYYFTSLGSLKKETDRIKWLSKLHACDDTSFCDCWQLQGEMRVQQDILCAGIVQLPGLRKALWVVEVSSEVSNLGTLWSANMGHIHSYPGVHAAQGAAGYTYFIQLTTLTYRRTPKSKNERFGG